MARSGVHIITSLFFTCPGSIRGIPLFLLSYPTALDERDIIFGGEDALRTAITHARTRHPEAIFVLSSCTAETIGDDVQGICASFPGNRIHVVPTGGFLGGSFEDGFSNALVSLLPEQRERTETGGIRLAE